MEGMEDLRWIFDMEISQIQLQDEMEDRNEIEIRGKGKQAKENQDTVVPDIQNVASSDEQVNVEESTLMVPADQNEPVTETQMNQGPKGGADMDPRKLRRILAKRESAQRARLRKRLYALEIEGEVRALEIEVAITPTRIKFFYRQNASLKRKCSSIDQKILVYTNELESKRAKYESLMRQREILTQLYLLQCQRSLRQSSMVANPGIPPGSMAALVGPNQLMGPMANMNLNQAGPQRLIQPAGLQPPPMLQPDSSNKQPADFQVIGNVN